MTLGKTSRESRGLSRRKRPGQSQAPRDSTSTLCCPCACLLHPALCLDRAPRTTSSASLSFFYFISSREDRVGSNNATTTTYLSFFSIHFDLLVLCFFFSAPYRTTTGHSLAPAALGGGPRPLLDSLIRSSSLRAPVRSTSHSLLPFSPFLSSTLRRVRIRLISCLLARGRSAGLFCIRPSSRFQ